MQTSSSRRIDRLVAQPKEEGMTEPETMSTGPSTAPATAAEPEAAHAAESHPIGTLVLVLLLLVVIVGTWVYVYLMMLGRG
jgi:hypothetical protein